MSAAPPTVLESNAFGTPFTLDTLWMERQEWARQRALEAAALAARALLDAADAPTMMVRTVFRTPVLMSELVSGQGMM